MVPCGRRTIWWSLTTRSCGHHAPTLHHPHPFAPQTEENHHRLDCAANPLSRLLRHRHVGAGQVRRVRGGGGFAEGAGPGRSARGGIRLCRRTRQTDASMVNHVRCIYEPFTASEISAKIADLVLPRISNGRGRSRSSIRPLKTCTRPCPITLATGIHGQISDARRLSGGESGLRELFREKRREKY